MGFTRRNSCWSNNHRRNAFLITGPKCSCLIGHLEIVSSCSGRLISIYNAFVVDNLFLLMQQYGFSFLSVSKKFFGFCRRNNTRDTVFDDNRIFCGEYVCVSSALTANAIVPDIMVIRKPATSDKLNNFFFMITPPA